MNYPKLPPKFKTKWIAALRSGEYKKGTGYLNVADAYCCLGVACKISGYSIKSGEMFILEDKKKIPHILRGESGIAELLSEMNDGSSGYKRMTFKQIATWIEKNL